MSDSDTTKCKGVHVVAVEKKKKIKAKGRITNDALEEKLATLRENTKAWIQVNEELRERKAKKKKK